MYNLKTEAVLAGAQGFKSGWSATVYVQLERNGICPAGAQWYMSGWSATVYVRLLLTNIWPSNKRHIPLNLLYSRDRFFICGDSDYF